MNKQIFSFKRLLGVAVCAGLILAGCTKRFEAINTDPHGLQEDPLKGDFAAYGGPFKQMQLGIHLYAPDWQFQRATSLGMDVYAGYFMSPTPFANNVNNLNYAMVDAWNDFIWTIPFEHVLAPAEDVLQRAKKDNFPNFEAWAIILKVTAMHRLADIFGPVVYTNYGKINEDGSITYDTQKDAYYAFFKDLDDAIAKLTPFASDPKAVKAFASFDLVYGGDYLKWAKYVNSLRLRLAVRLAKADPAKAKAEAEKALSNTFGVLENNAEDFIIDSRNVTNPLNTISRTWGDQRMGAPMESIMVGYDDPRLPLYFETSVEVPGKYKGIRQGIAISNGDTYRTFSAMASMGTKMPMLTSAETWFLRAEAKLRGWNVPNVNSPQEAYEKGIQRSLTQWGVGASFEDYKNSVAKPIPYVDPINNANNVAGGSAYLSTVSPKWDESGSTEEKLEQIITQKWIAIYPSSAEAWAEFRRTGYPKLFPVVINNSQGVIPNGQFIKRINFAVSEKRTNKTGYDGAVQKLGGPDNIGTRVWWDKP